MQTHSPGDEPVPETTAKSPFPRWRLVPLDEMGVTPAFVPKRLRPGLNTIGREDANHIVLNSTLVSRQHAKLVISPHGAVIHDLDSHNGVFLDGTKIRSADVSLGQRLYIADICCVLEPYDGDPEHLQLEEAIDALKLRPLPLRTEVELASSARPAHALMRVLELLCGSEDEAFFAGVAEAVRAVTKAETIRIWTLNSGDDLEQVLSEGDAPANRELESELARRAVYLQAALASHVGNGSPGAETGQGTLWCFPFLFHGRCQGALYITGPETGSDEQTEAFEFLQGVAHLVAARLDGATANAHGGYEIRTLRERNRALEHELVQARSALGGAPSLLDQDTQVKTGIGALASTDSNALNIALENALPARVATAIRSIARGAAPGQVSAEMTTVFQIHLSDLDVWVMDVPPEALKARLDWLCERVGSICRPAGGEVEQALGHGLLVRFPGDRAGVVHATRCALQLLEETAALGGQAQAGIHHGVDVSGVFGPGATLMHAGEATVVAKAASEYARSGTLYGGEPIRDVVSSEPGFTGIALGPHFVRGMAEPVSLFQIHRMPGGRP